jgi:hypothetical protein
MFLFNTIYPKGKFRSKESFHVDANCAERSGRCGKEKEAFDEEIT